MNTQEMKQCIAKLEECADEAKKAVQAAGSVPSDVRQCVDEFHQQARDGKQSAGSADDATLRQCVLKLEETADRAMQACRKAGNQVDAQTQQAIQKAHTEASRAKKELQAGSPA